MKINLCCGKDYREGYINVDFSDIASDGKSIKVDKMINLLDREDWVLKFGENSADEVVFRESLEHFNRHNGLIILNGIYRVLKPNGILDLSVPNALKQMKILLQMMTNPTPVSFKEFEEAHERFTYWKWHDDLMGATRSSNGTDGDSHKTLYTKQSLIPILEEIGFKIETILIHDNIFVKAKK